MTVRGDAAHFPEDCYARPTADGIVFVTSSTSDATPTYSAYRWTVGAAAIEVLYESVTLLPTQRLPSHLDVGARQWQLTTDGTLTYFSLPNDNVTGYDLLRVDGAGAHVLATIPPGPWSVQGPWLLDGAQYAGIGTNPGSDVVQLDLVRAAP